MYLQLYGIHMGILPTHHFSRGTLRQLLHPMYGTCVVYTSGDGVYDVQVEKERDNTYFGDLNTVDGHFQIK